MSASEAEGRMARALLEFAAGAAEAQRTGVDPGLVEQMADAFAAQARPDVERGRRLRAQVAALMPTEAQIAPFINARCFARVNRKQPRLSRRGAHDMEKSLQQAEQAWDDARDALAESRGISKSAAGLALSHTSEGSRIYNEIQLAKSRAIFAVKKVKQDVRHVADELLDKMAKSYAAEHSVPLHTAYQKMFAVDVGARDLYSVSRGYEPTTKAAPPPPPERSDAQIAQSELSRLSRLEADKTGTSFSQAMSAVLQTQHGRALYARIYAGYPK